MSVSSGSDVTIPMQDSPPPPPSPYANKGGGGPDLPTGIENKAYSPSGSEKPSTTPTKKKGGGDHTEVAVEEAVNPELINMSIMSTIPAKPQSEFGPYEQMDDYFIPVNQHKKFLSRRSEKLYVTKDKRKEGGWKKCLCWTFAAFVLAAIVAVAILAAVGVIPQGAGTEEKLAIVGEVSTTPSSILDIIGFSSSTTSLPPSSSEEPSTSPRPTRPPDDTHVGHAAKATFDITSLTFEAALANKSSSRFHELASQVEDEMRKILREEANLENVTVRVDEFEPGSVHVKMFLSWAADGMELETLQRSLMGKSTLGPFSIGPLALYNIVNHCKFNNNNGCSHDCGYDYAALEFACSCPPPMTLGGDKKTCEVDGGEEPQPESEPSSPSEEPVVSSSPEPEVEPEAEAAAPETQAEPEPTVPEEEEVVVSSSVAPDLGGLRVGDVSSTSTSTTTAEPRLDLALGDLELTTTGAPEESEPEPEVPVEPEVVDVLTPSSTTTSTTTETPLPPVEIPAQEEEKTEDIAATTIAAPEESKDESVVESAVVPSEETPSVAPLTPEPSTEATPVEEFPALSTGESETERPSEEEEPSRVNLEEEDSVFVHHPPPSPSTTTSTSTTTEVPAAAIIGETHSEPQEVDQLTSSLQRDSLEAVAVDEAPPTETPTAVPTPNEEVEFVQLSQGKSSEEGEVSSNSTSSERMGRQESSFGSGSVEELPEVVTTPPESTEAAPNSGEIMVYSDNRHASQQQSGSNSESSETSSADTHETVDVISANNPIELPAVEPTSTTTISTPTSASPLTSSSAAPASIEVEVVAVAEREETTTIRPISLEKDIDVNNEAGVTEDSLHSEDVDRINTSVGSGVGELPSLAAESSETEEVERPNRDHRDANSSSAEETTTSPVVVFDEVESEAEGVTTDAPSSTSTSTTTTTASPLSSSTEVPSKNSTSSSVSSEERPGDNESENQLR